MYVALPHAHEVQMKILFVDQKRPKDRMQLYLVSPPESAPAATAPKGTTAMKPSGCATVLAWDFGMIISNHIN